MIRDRAWDREAKQEYQAACSEAWESSDRQSDRSDRFLEIIADGVQAHRRWAQECQRESLRMGAAVILKNWKKAQRTVALSYNGQVITKPRTIGVKRQNDEGEFFDTQVLFDFTTWEELDKKRESILLVVRSYNETVAMIDRVRALHDLAPAAANPDEAARAIGTTLDKWLAA